MSLELEALNQKVQEAKDRTEVILRQRYGMNRTLGFLPVNDRRRLYNLFVWSERYSLSLEAILHILFEHYDQFRQRERRKRTMGLPVKTQTLMGRRSEDIIKEKLLDLYPNGENIHLYKQQQQQLQVNERFEQEHLSSQTKLLEDCSSIEEYIQSYDNRMEKIYSQMSSVREYLSRHTRPYRDNPWR